MRRKFDIPIGITVGELKALQDANRDPLFEAITSFLENRDKYMVPLQDAVVTVLHILYGIHKGYEVLCTSQPSVHFLNDDDILLRDLERIDVRHERLKPYGLYSEITALYKALPASEYIDAIEGLMDELAKDSGNSRGEFFTLSEITSLIAHLINKTDCSSIYDPFCGTASIISKLDSTRFVGQDINEFTSIVARLNAEVLTGMDKGISCGDSLNEWSTESFDAIVTCPPIGLKIQDNYRIDQMTYQRWPNDSLSGLIINRAFNINNASQVILLDTLGFCFSLGKSLELRKNLIQSNLLDMVIALPEGLMYGSSLPSALIICKRWREDDAPVTFADASSFITGGWIKDVSLDVEKFINALESKDETMTVDVQINEIIDHNYNLTPALYCSERIPVEGTQRRVKLDEILTPVSGKLCTPFDGYHMVPSNLASKDFITVLLNKDKDGKMSGGAGMHGFNVGNEGKYLIENERTGYSLRTDGKEFCCYGKVFRINEELVSPEYLVYFLTNDSLLSRKGMTISNSLGRKVVIDSKEKQGQIVSKLLQQYDEQTRVEREADDRRLGIKRNISDLEHMLGSTQLRIEDIIKCLEEMTPESSKYRDTVRSLKDNVEYMNRMIKYSNAQLSPENFNKKDSIIAAFIADYAESWSNYGGGYFRLDVVNMLEENLYVTFDKVMLTVMLDSILSNAVRHGFHKRKNYTPDNRVEIRLESVEYNGKPFVLLKVANNGDPVAEGFTMQDYISRGRYTVGTGRSGLGGYHVYQIIKGHGGFLYLDSNKVWNTVVELLIPLSDNNIINLDAYEHECI